MIARQTVNVVARRLALWLAGWVIALAPRAERLYVSARRALREEALRRLAELASSAPAAPPWATFAATATAIELDPRTAEGASQVIRRVIPTATVVHYIGLGCRDERCRCRTPLVDRAQDIEIGELGGYVRPLDADEWAKLIEAGVPLMPFEAVARLRVARYIATATHFMAREMGRTTADRPQIRGAA